jgi:hypothetical protein
MNTEDNPYAAPSSPMQDAVAAEAAPALWNPNAAASWSLLFSPVFGAYLQMRNWQALGDAQKAKVSWYWCVGSLAFIVVGVVASILVPDTSPIQKLTDRSGIVLLLAWYLSNGKQQPAYVKERFGKDYPRKGWAAPLGIAFGAVFAFFVAAVVLGIVLAATGRLH